MMGMRSRAARRWSQKTQAERPNRIVRALGARSTTTPIKLPMIGARSTGQIQELRLTKRPSKSLLDSSLQIPLGWRERVRHSRFFADCRGLVAAEQTVEKLQIARP